MDTLRRAIVVHGGAGAGPVPEGHMGGCHTAALIGLERLRGGAEALEAAMAAVVAMEDDGRFNAGSGSVLRLDGRTVEMDASVMDSTGVLGAVACISGVKNPVLVARRVAETPHALLCGPGATAFARRCGFQEFHDVSPKARDRHLALVKALRQRKLDGLPSRWSGFDLERYWNLEVPYHEAIRPGDTVGAVALDERGVFAVANSTGGSSPMLRGRIGDTPIIGAGFYAGAAGAVAATGLGEEIMRRMLARRVYEAMASGKEPQAACEAAVREFPREVSVGVIAMGRGGYGIASSGPMAAHSLVELA